MTHIMQQTSLSQRLKICLAVILLLLGAFSARLVWSAPAATEIQNWTPAVSLPAAVASRNAVVHNNFVYLVGGKNVTDLPVNLIYAAAVQTDGSLSAWSVAAQLQVPVYLHAVVATDAHLYVIGGWDGARPRAEVWRTPFGANGSLGAWERMPDYPIALDLHDATLIGNRIYVVGGWDGKAPLGQIYAAEVQSSGLGVWQLMGTLPKGLYRLSVAGRNSMLYVTGGYDADKIAHAEVYASQVNADGTLGAWQNATTLPAPVYYHETVVHDGRLVVIAGRNDGALFKEVYSAAINANGLLGPWSAVAPLPAPLFRFAAVTVNQFGSDFIYVIGGLRNDTDYRAEVYHSTAPIAPTATATQTPTATPSPTATATPTPTPTPTPAISIQLQNQPQAWVAPGAEIAYSIVYRNDGNQKIDNVVISNTIPLNVELVANSVEGATDDNITITGSSPGATILWNLGELKPGKGGKVGYRVRRPQPASPIVPNALSIEVAAPTAAQFGQEITYAFQVTNRAPIPLTNLVVTNTLPVGAIYVRGADGPPVNNVVQWSIANLAKESSTTVEVVVTAKQSLVNSDYRVHSNEGANAKGRLIAVTIVNQLPPLFGDGVAIVNSGALITWNSAETSTGKTSNAAHNPTFQLYLPLVARGK